jgi:hypothetical protein
MVNRANQLSWTLTTDCEWKLPKRAGMRSILAGGEQSLRLIDYGWTTPTMIRTSHPFGSDSANANIVVPAGYTSTWLTGDPPAR